VLVPHIFILTWYHDLTNTAFLHSIPTAFIVLHTANGETQVGTELLSASTGWPAIAGILTVWLPLSPIISEWFAWM
jgi:hypothetical protein